MTDTQHTPTPWKPSTCGLGVWSGNEPLGANKIIANCDAVSRSKPENAANAQHIIKCVNLHDELLEAAIRGREACTILEAECRDTGDHQNGDIWLRKAEACDAAIAQAEGRSA